MSVWSLFAAFFVGLLQGILEWLPISSQGNLVMLMMTVLGLEPPQALSTSIYLHIGTGLAAVAYFREDIFGILGRDSEENRLLLRFLLITTAVTGLVGLPLFLVAREASYFGGILLALTGVALIVTGIIQKVSRSGGTRTVASLDAREGVVMGLTQGLSAIPGLSRSGLTTSALFLKRYTGGEAFRISFLMSIPATFAAVAGLAVIEGFPRLDTELMVAISASFLSALFSIDLLLRLARRMRFWGLCIVLGLLALILNAIWLI